MTSRLYSIILVLTADWEVIRDRDGRGNILLNRDRCEHNRKTRKANLETIVEIGNKKKIVHKLPRARIFQKHCTQCELAITC